MRPHEYIVINVFTSWRAPRPIKAPHINVAYTLAQRLYRKTQGRGLAVVSYRESLPVAQPAVAA